LLLPTIATRCFFLFSLVLLLVALTMGVWSWKTTIEKPQLLPLDKPFFFLVYVSHDDSERNTSEK
jgi:hypothetical protein